MVMLAVPVIALSDSVGYAPGISVPDPQNIQAPVRTQLSVLPLSFIPNAVQVDPQVTYAFVVKLNTGPARTVSPVLVTPYGYLPKGTPVTAVFTINVAGVYPSGGEEQLFTDLYHPNWTYTIIVNGVENLRPVMEGSTLIISGFELSYRASDVVSVHVTLKGAAPTLQPPVTNFTVVKIQTMNNDVVPGSVVTVEAQTTATNPPVTDFTGSPTSGTAPLTVSYTDSSSNNPTGWAWFFGDENFTAPWTQVNASSGWTARY
ncbi:MAG: hypothetical protein NTU88_11845, partial [Armatimonadetes bacterium]|nr:hypothetical protein [Armatimonadota bacterium]